MTYSSASTIRRLIEQVVTETMNRLEADRARLSSRLAFAPSLREVPLRHRVYINENGLYGTLT